VAEDLARLMPAGVLLYAEMDGFGTIGQAAEAGAEGPDSGDVLGQLAQQRFGLEAEPVAAFVRSIEHTALGLRRGAHGMSYGVALRLASAAPAEKLLGNGQLFDEVGPGPAGGKRLALSLDVAAKLGGTAPPAVVWYPAQRLLLVASPAFLDEVEGVLGGGAPPLGDEQRFRTARELFDPEAEIHAFFDAAALFDESDVDDRRVLDAVLAGRTPITASVRLGVPVRMSFRAGLAGTAMPDARLVAPPVELTLPRRLPVETSAFAAYSSRLGLKGEGLYQALLARLSSLEPDWAEALRQAESTWPVEPSALVGSLGDQGVIAMVVPNDLPAGRPSLAALWAGSAVVAIQHLGEDASARAAARALIERAAAELGKRHRVRRTPEGFAADSREPERTRVMLALVDGHLFAAAGSAAMTARSLEAFREGRGTLGDDAARLPTVEAVEAPHLLLVFDAMRSLSYWSKAWRVEQLEAQLAMLKQMAGGQALVGAAALGWTVQGELWQVRGELVDAPTMAMLAAIAYAGVRQYLAAQPRADARQR